LRKTILNAFLILLCAAFPAQGAGGKMASPEAIKKMLSSPPGHQAIGVFPPEYQEQPIIPEVSTRVFLSSSDANRIVCPNGEIKDVIFSDDKGVKVKITGNNAFIKFRVTKKEGEDVYSSTPTELYVVCGESVFNLIAIPQPIPAQTVRLSSGPEKIAKNAAMYGGLPFEKKVISVIKSIYTNNIPEGFSVSNSNKKISLFKDLNITLVRSYRVEGEGLLADEYRVSSSKDGELKLSEKDFLNKKIAARPLGITMDRHTLKPGETARIIVVEQVPQAVEGGNDGVQ